MRFSLVCCDEKTKKTSRPFLKQYDWCAFESKGVCEEIKLAVDGSAAKIANLRQQEEPSRGAAPCPVALVWRFGPLGVTFSLVAGLVFGDPKGFLDLLENVLPVNPEARLLTVGGSLKQLGREASLVNLVSSQGSHDENLRHGEDSGTISLPEIGAYEVSRLRVGLAHTLIRLINPGSTCDQRL